MRVYWLILQAILACGVALPAAAKTYRNAALGFSFRLPASTVGCAPDPSTGPGHGVIVWLDGRGGECNDKITRPKIIAVGDYNAMGWPTPRAANEVSCKGTIW